MMNRTALYAAVAAAGALLAPTAAYATAFAVNTNSSSFTDILYDGSTPCVFNPASPTAAPLQCLGPSNSDINRIEWAGGDIKSMHGTASATPGTSGIQQYFTGNYSSNPGVDATQVEIGGLQLTTGAHPQGSLSFVYDLVIEITAPTGATESYSYDLGITTTSTASGGTNTVQTILSGVLAPMTVEAPDGELFTLSNFTWSDIDCTTGVNNGGASCAPVAASYADGVWSVTSNGSGQISDLILSADVTVTIPEPGTLAIFGSSFAFLGWMRRRRKRTS